MSILEAVAIFLDVTVKWAKKNTKEREREAKQ